MTFTLKAEKRDPKIKNEDLRNAGQIPAIYYGANKDSVSITINYAEFIKLYKEAGESSMITLTTPDGDKPALVCDFQKDAISGKIIHVDFKIIDASKPIEVAIPFEFVGESPAVHNGLGTMTKVMHEIEVRVLPKDLPHEITVDISVLVTLEDQILVKDLKLPAGVEVLSDAESAVVVMAAIREEKEEEASAPIDFSQIEVEKKGKEETPGEGEAEAK